jgi:hypothetical protein
MQEMQISQVRPIAMNPRYSDKLSWLSWKESKISRNRHFAQLELIQNI